MIRTDGVAGKFGEIAALSFRAETRVGAPFLALKTGRRTAANARAISSRSAASLS